MDWALFLIVISVAVNGVLVTALAMVRQDYKDLEKRFHQVRMELAALKRSDKYGS